MAKTRKKRSDAGTKVPAGPPPGWSEPDPLDDLAAPSVDVSKYVKAAGEIKGWGKATEVLDRTTSVRTVFPDFNRAVRVGGLPVRRIHTIHGPTHGGKTAFVLGLLKSFADLGYLSGYVDAEHALDLGFAEEIVRDLDSKPNFMANRPKSYEETIENVDAFLKSAAQIRKGHPEHKSILIIDSINKLVPERELKKILDQGKKGAEELTKGHHGRYRAALNQAWLDKLTPQIAQAECALVLIAQERDETDTTSFFTEEFKVKGGAALLFDASLVIRIMKASPVFLKADDKKNEGIVGFAHRARIWKSKVGHMAGRYSDCIFHLSNGRLVPEGLDTARDAFKLGVHLDIVKQAGAWYTYKGRRTQGENKLIVHLSKSPERLHELLGDIASELDKREGRAA